MVPAPRNVRRAGARTASVVAALVASLLLSVMPGSPARAERDESLEQSLVVAINELRASVGVPALILDTALTASARAWSLSMSEDGALSHSTDLANRLPGGVGKAGQNVGMGPDLVAIEGRFRDSPSHYRNLVDPAYAFLGVGVVAHGDLLWVTTEFRSAPRPAAPAPVPARRPSRPRAR